MSISDLIPINIIPSQSPTPYNIHESKGEMGKYTLEKYTFGNYPSITMRRGQDTCQTRICIVKHLYQREQVILASYTWEDAADTLTGLSDQAIIEQVSFVNN